VHKKSDCMVVQVGQKAPNLKISQWVQGLDTNLDKQGDNIILVDVFQVNCPGCFMYGIPESIEIYKKNNRTDLLEIEKGEVEIISIFLPKQMNEAETMNICKETIQSMKAQGPKDIGIVMDTIKKKYSDVLDFSKVGALVKEILK